jgi:hypothetical protein
MAAALSDCTEARFGVLNPAHAFRTVPVTPQTSCGRDGAWRLGFPRKSSGTTPRIDSDVKNRSTGRRLSHRFRCPAPQRITHELEARLPEKRVRGARAPLTKSGLQRPQTDAKIIGDIRHGDRFVHVVDHETLGTADDTRNKRRRCLPGVPRCNCADGGGAAPSAGIGRVLPWPHRRPAERLRRWAKHKRASGANSAKAHRRTGADQTAAARQAGAQPADAQRLQPVHVQPHRFLLERAVERQLGVEAGKERRGLAHPPLRGSMLLDDASRPAHAMHHQRQARESSARRSGPGRCKTRDQRLKGGALDLHRDASMSRARPTTSMVCGQ